MTHGQRRAAGNKPTATYNSWSNMRKRFDNPHNKSYPDYGGRGITYQQDWTLFENFYRDLKDCPPGRTLGRRDNDGNYTKENCRWETSAEQANNKRIYKTSRTGISGVNHKGNKFRALGCLQGRQHILYEGSDYFEACCARKSFEVLKRGA